VLLTGFHRAGKILDAGGAAMSARRFGRTEFHPPPLYGNFGIYGLSAHAREIWAVGVAGGSTLTSRAARVPCGVSK